jgi:hypothetical protein
MRTATLLSGLCIFPAFLAGQGAYAPSSDTLFYLLVNPYRMYWLRDGDTLSQPMHAVSIEAEHWQRATRELRVVSRQLSLDVHRRVRTDTFAITPVGAVRAINGHAPGLNERVDFLPRLPGRKLVTGLSWSDTLDVSQASGPIAKLYTVTRTWRVERLFDSVGGRLAMISATGVVHYSDGWWLDSAAGRFASIDARGPLTERVLFSINQSRLIERAWSMNLTGQGVIPTETGADTTTAGLISSQSQRLIPPDRAHLLARPLPGADTSHSYNQSPILVHVVDRQRATIGSAMARNDGLVGTARASFNNGRVSSYEAVWTDTSATPHRVAVSVVGDSLNIQQAGHADTTAVIPERWWGIADYAMNELLVPVLLAHAADTAAPFAIYRPYARHWDKGTAILRRYGDNFVASYRIGDDTLQTVLLITPDGDLLMAENSGPTGAQRLPSPGSPRRALLERIINPPRKGGP